MQLSQRRPRCRELTGPTPHSVSVRAKVPSSRPADWLIQDQQRQEAARDQVLEFTKDQQTCDIKTSWLKSSDSRFLRGNIQRRVQEALSQRDVQVQERRDRLHQLLEAEEQQLLQEMEEKVETQVEKQEKMKERAKILREQRERDRQQLVSDKLDQLFRQQCEELRSLESRRREQQVCLERAAQVRRRQERLQLQRQEEKLFEELWEADRRAKEEQEEQRAQRQQQRSEEQLEVIRSQMSAAEQQRLKQRALREEEASLLLQQQQMQQLQQQRERQQQIQEQQRRRRQLDEDLRVKVKRVSREQQAELQLHLNILNTLLQQETDHRQEAAHRKARLCEEQRRYRQYLCEELQRQRREEEEMEQLMEEQLKEVWAKREEQRRLQREARNRLMEEVMEARRQQVQHTLELNLQRQVELATERDELNTAVEEMKLKDAEDKRRRRQTCEAYRADLRAQMEQQEQVRAEQKVQAQKEHQQSLIQQELYNQRKEQILSRPSSDTTTLHPFSRAGGPRLAPN